MGRGQTTKAQGWAGPGQRRVNRRHAKAQAGHLSTEQKNVVLDRRQFPDKCFLTRKEQHDKKAWWNQSLFPLRNRWQDPNDDQLEFNWGYEDPIVQREFYTTIDICYADNMRWDGPSREKKMNWSMRKTRAKANQ
jgi:hypothetical protein